jgi:hypothetical protein
MDGHEGLVSEKTVMHVRQIAESGSYARFFFQLIAMYLIASGLAFCLIAAAYAEERPLKPAAGTLIAKTQTSVYSGSVDAETPFGSQCKTSSS